MYNILGVITSVVLARLQHNLIEKNILHDLLIVIFHSLSVTLSNAMMIFLMMTLSNGNMFRVTGH